MSIAVTGTPPAARRVRHQAREVVAVMAFSLASSVVPLPDRRAGHGPGSAGLGQMPSPRHVPVLLDRVVALLAPALDRPGAVVVDATLGLGGHTEAILDALPAGPAGRHRPRPATRSRWPGSGSRRTRDRATFVHAVYDEIPDVLAELGLAARRRRPVRPRRLLDAARRPRARLRLRPGRAARHADGRHRRAPPPPTCSTPTRPPSWPGSSASTARRSSPGGSRDRDRRASATRSRSPPRPGWSSCCTPPIPAPARRTGGHPAKRTFQALRIEVNDELDVLRRAIPAAIDVDRRRRPGRRGVLPLARGPAGQAGVHRRARSSDVPPDLPVVPEGHEPTFRLVTRGLGEGRRARDHRQPPRRLGAAARRRTHPTTEQGRMSTPLPHSQGPRPADRRGRRRAGPADRRAAACGARAAPRVPFVTLVSLLLLGGVVGLLMFNTTMQQTSFAATALEEQAGDLTAREQTLADGARRSSATRSASPEQAQALGMVAGGPPAFLGSPTARCSASRCRPRWPTGCRSCRPAVEEARRARPRADHRRGAARPTNVAGPTARMRATRTAPRVGETEPAG